MINSFETNLNSVPEDVLGLLLGLQDELNCMMAGGDWIQRDLPFSCAIFEELQELIGHTGWEWWKPASPVNRMQMKLEVVDIFHFMISHFISSENRREYCVIKGNLFSFDLIPTKVLAERLNRAISSLDEKSTADSLPLLCAKLICAIEDETRGADYRMVLMLFRDLMEHVELNAYELILIYLGKYSLNRFRNDNGAKSGFYSKKWIEIGYEEDNDFMLEIISLEIFPEVIFQSSESCYEFVDKIYEKISDKYDELIEKKNFINRSLSGKI